MSQFLKMKKSTSLKNGMNVITTSPLSKIFHDPKSSKSSKPLTLASEIKLPNSSKFAKLAF